MCTEAIISLSKAQETHHKGRQKATRYKEQKKSPYVIAANDTCNDCGHCAETGTTKDQQEQA